MRVSLTAAALIGALTLQGCSSRPREFRPTLAAAPASQSSFETAFSECRQLMVEGKLDANGQLTSVGAGAAAGVATAAVGAAATVAAGGYGALAAASATVVLLPFAAVAGAWRMAKARKTKKERAVQQAMAGCLTTRGYPVVGWEPMSSKEAAAAREAGRTR